MYSLKVKAALIPILIPKREEAAIGFKSLYLVGHSHLISQATVAQTPASPAGATSAFLTSDSGPSLKKSTHI